MKGKCLAALLVGMFYMVFRDIPQKGSLGKRIIKLRVVDAETRGPAYVSQRVVRNVFMLLTWAEFLVFFVKEKCIGDMVAKTDVCKVN